MKKKNNILTVALISVLIISIAVFFTACGNKPDTDNDSSTENSLSDTELSVPEIELDSSEETTEPSTQQITETEKVSEQITEKPTQKVTEKVTEKVTQKPANNSGKTDTPKNDNKETTNKTTPKKQKGVNWDGLEDEPMNPGAYVQDPNTNARDIDHDAELNGWNTDWTLAG